MKKTCNNCGFENAEKDKFCRKCGTKVSEVEKPVEKKVEIIPKKPKKSKKLEIPTKMVLGIAIIAFILSIAAISSAFLVSPSSLSAATVGSKELANDSVTSQKVVDGTITDSDIDPIGISRIKANSITGYQIADYTISLSHLTVDLANMLSGTITIENNSITTEKIKNGTIQTNDLAGNSITSAKIKDGEIKSSDIATDAVTSIKIAPAAVDTGELADGAVTYDKMNIKILYGHENNVISGQTINHNMGATPTSVVVTPRYNQSLPANSVIIVNVYDVDTNTFKVAMSVFDGSGNIIEIDGSTWGPEDIDWVATRIL
jgi:hypothetical protein